MPLREFLAERAAVDHGGRRFVCRAPTVGTILTALVSFPEPILAAYRAAQDGALGDQPVETVLTILTANRLAPQMGRVLATCVDAAGMDRFDVATLVAGDAELRRRLAAAVAELADWQRIVRSLDLDKVAEIGADDDAPEVAASVSEFPTRQEAAIVRLAREFGVRPDTIVEWPHEMFLSAQIVLSYMDADAPTGGAAAGAPYLSADNAPPGVGVSRQEQ